MAQSRVFYLCDGERENCKRNMCYKNGGDCKHTKDIGHAKNFSRKYVRQESSSFYENEAASKKSDAAETMETLER